VAVFFSVVIPLIGIARGGEFRQMILTGLSLAFATIPEELPIIITMVLGLGAYQLSRQNFLAKRLRAAETLGDITVILTDKTGTLTESRMQVAAVWPKQQERVLLEAALGTVSSEMPDALEQAVLERANALGVAPPQGQILRLRHPGDGRRSKAVLWRHADGSLRAHLTGAPEEVFARCREVPAALRAQLEAEAARGRRVIAAATRVIGAQDANRPLEELDQGLDLAGILSLADPPRAGVKETIAQLAGAGIRTVMVTGDHPATAAAIAGSFDAQTKALVEWFEKCKDDGIVEEDICILGRTNEIVKETTEMLRGKGYDVVVLQRRKADDRTKSGLRIGTMHRAKGLEFEAVAIIDVNDGVVPPKRLLDMASDPVLRRSVMETDKSLLHVSATRAKKRLFVSASGAPSRIISPKAV
jgi:magnesium-transporting ATPase (P-type)